MHTTDPANRSTRTIRAVLWILAALALAYLIVEHPAHLLGWLPFLAIMACPLLHLFMHRGHHHHSHDPKPREETHS